MRVCLHPSFPPPPPTPPPPTPTHPTSTLPGWSKGLEGVSAALPPGAAVRTWAAPLYSHYPSDNYKGRGGVGWIGGGGGG